jgi:peptide deformylase|tara:strand:+ start:468 stop:1088 length:621 start_codon:yes stop_codon:yes gene_type:complete
MAVKDNDLVQIWDGSKIDTKKIDFLRTPTKEVAFPLSNHVKQVVTDLIDTFRAVPCAGIAANQLGYDKKIFIGMKHDNDKSVSDDPSKNIDDVKPESENLEIYINPQIDKTDKSSTQNGEEGCLSIPDISLELERYDKIKVRYYNQEGKAIKKPLSGFISRLFQHELDHLNGNLMLEHENIRRAKISQKSEEYSDLIRQVFQYINK